MNLYEALVGSTIHAALKFDDRLTTVCREIKSVDRAPQGLIRASVILVISMRCHHFAVWVAKHLKRCSLFGSTWRTALLDAIGTYSDKYTDGLRFLPSEHFLNGLPKRLLV